ncbi:MAG TPA: V-type ATP synthase subunit D [Methanoregulaceae archaeon]|nr:V-type ATP synthase subunit D [Methanoregulaceae archaeon]
MTTKAISGIRPTRIELLKLKKQELLAERGHDLLEEKLDAMVIEFFRYVDTYKNLVEKAQDKIDCATKELSESKMILGSNRLEEISLSAQKMVDIPMDTRSVMGVRVPRITMPESIKAHPQSGYSYLGTTARLDEAATSFEEAVRIILELAELEGTVRRLALEIRSTRRRVNALENILIPRLQATRRYIEMHLDEREREDLFRRKRTKKLIQEHE